MPAPSRAIANNPRRIVVRGVNWLGDAVMTTPALQRLKEVYPNTEIHLVTPAKLADLWKNHPAICGIHSFSPTDKALSFGRKLRPLNADIALILPNSFRSALEVWWARIPQRVGYTGQLRRLLLTQAIPRRPDEIPMRKRTENEIRQLIASAPQVRSAQSQRAKLLPRSTSAGSHHIYQYLNLVAYLGAKPEALAPKIFVTDTELEQTFRKFGLKSETDSRPLVGLNPGAEYGPAKRWPISKFVAVIDLVQQQIPCRWLIFGGKADQSLAEEIRLQAEKRFQSTIPNLSFNLINLAGATSLRELCVLLHACKVVATNDTGPMHVAAAVGTPVVVPFGSTDSTMTSPGLPGDPKHTLLQAQTPCSPCFLRNCPIDFRCMESITLADVAKGILQPLQHRP